MAVYILLFSGVGGETQLPTKPLREGLTSLGFENVGTYINSGNAYLKTSKPHAQVSQLTQQLCAQEFGFEKDIHVVSLPE